MTLFHLSVAWWEFILRAVVIYGFLLLILRLTGKRQVGQLAPFDFVLLLVLSNAVQNSLNAGDNSMVGGMISATTLVFLNAGVGYLTYRSKRAETLIDGVPQILVHNGVLYQAALDRAMISSHELHAALRRAGCLTLAEVRLAMLENNGAISVIAAQHAPPH
jgi:uncharacterized membrane protein YcaP (DUF421 family)